MKACAGSMAPSASFVTAKVWPRRRGLAGKEANGPPDGDSLCEVSPSVPFVDYLLLGLN